MHDLKRSKKKMYKKQMPAMINSYNEESTVEIEDLERGCKNKTNINNSNNACNCAGNQSTNQNNNNNQKHDCHHDHHDHHEHHDYDEFECVCECKKSNNHCEPCEAESDTCVANPCAGDQCCNGITPTYSSKNASPVAIEAQRI